MHSNPLSKIGSIFQQSINLTTDLVSIPEGIGLAVRSITDGWWQDDADSETGESHGSPLLAKPIGQTRALLCRQRSCRKSSWNSVLATARKSVRTCLFTSVFESQPTRAARKASSPPEDWTRVQIRCPRCRQTSCSVASEPARDGTQRLPRDGNSSNPDALSRIRLRPSADQPRSSDRVKTVAGMRPPQIRTVDLEDSSADGGRAIEMPVASYHGAGILPFHAGRSHPSGSAFEFETLP